MNHSWLKSFCPNTSDLITIPEKFDHFLRDLLFANCMYSNSATDFKCGNFSSSLSHLVIGVIVPR
jgi:hypothetical protein